MDYQWWLTHGWTVPNTERQIVVRWQAAGRAGFPGLSDFLHISWRLIFEGYPSVDQATADWFEMLPPPPPPRGIARLVGQAWEDDQGRFIGFGATVFWLVWAARFNRAHLQETLKWLSGYGVNYARVLSNTDRENRVIDPAWPGYFDTVDAGLRDLADAGMRMQPILFSGGEMVKPYAREDWVRRWAAFANGRRDHILCVEMGLESWKFMGLGELVTLTALWKELSDIPVMPTAPAESFHSGREVLDVWVQDGLVVDLYGPHLDRTPGGSGVRPCRQGWHFNGTVWVDSEPWGPRRGQDDPATLAIGMAISRLSGAVSTCYHCASGVHDDRLLREEPNAEAILKALGAMHDFLPVELGAAPTYGNEDEEGHPYRELVAGQRVRCYAAGPVDGSYYVTVLGQEDRYEIEAKWGMRIEMFRAEDVSRLIYVMKLRKGERRTFLAPGHYLHKVTPLGG